MDEFELIDRFFRRRHSRPDVLLGIGDDAALVRPQEGRAVAAAVATLSGGAADSGRDFGHALARSALNRLAARGVAPAWCTLALSLPEPAPEWLEDFSAALHAALADCGAVLIGGDTTRGALTATLIAHGPEESTRDPVAAPRAGDAIYVSGTLGDAAAAGDDAAHRRKPPRVDEGLSAWPLCCAAGDLRDGLAASLLRLLEGSGFGAAVFASELPVRGAARTLLDRAGGAKIIVEASDDAEICVIVPAAEDSRFRRSAAGAGAGFSRVGRVVDAPGVHLDAADAG